MGHQNSLYNVLIWGRPIILLAALYGLQQYGILDAFLAKNPVLRIESWGDILIALLIIIAGIAAIYSGVTKVWNKITPYKNKATYVETEICYILSAAIGAPLFALIFLHISVLSALQLGAIIGFAALSSAAYGLLVNRWNEKHTHQLEALNALDDTAQHVPMADNTFWNDRKAYAIAALIFNLAVFIFMAVIVFIKSGQLISASWLVNPCSLFTLFTLTLFGHFIVALGHRLLKTLKLKPKSEFRRHVAAYSLGYMAVISAFVIPIIAIQNASSALSPSQWVSYIMAYLIIILSAALAGLFFSKIYIPKNSAG